MFNGHRTYVARIVKKTPKTKGSSLIGLESGRSTHLIHKERPLASAYGLSQNTQDILLEMRIKVYLYLHAVLYRDTLRPN